MSKVTSKPGTMLYPVPTVMVSCGDGEKDNIITIGWSGGFLRRPFRRKPG